ncbi:CapA family protein [Aneurinibacillus sp. Ricciae_BoGa-3]|uniref:CapA family protein n=1 Tax=Aneurinibacillus sp. Ricciae_BoGa-3 TaxID=3022697 RepID=UPI0023411167|nr:CapA family protein [Aneurinibacillus sp. Ricciae_BoGa-3]WCK53448.1 CapA family protein [Aneurinibacillus sp. Ricciae_BoGa-3]
MKTDLYTLASRLQEYRYELGINEEEVVKATGIPPERLHMIEEGNSPATIEELEQLFAFFNLDENTLQPRETEAAVGKRSYALIGWIVALALLSVAGYGGWGMWKSFQSAEGSRTKPGIQEIMSQKQTTPDDKTVGELLNQASSQSSGSQAKLAARVRPSSASDGVGQKPQAALNPSLFYAVIHPDTPYHTGQAQAGPAADYQLYPVYDFKAGQGLPVWLSTPPASGKVGVDVANHDILAGQSRDAVDKEIAELRKKNITVQGYGMTKEAFSPHVIEKNGERYGFISFSRAVPDVSWKATDFEPGVADAYGEHAAGDVQRAKRKSDFLIVCVYWGSKDQTAPQDYQTTLAHKIIDAGADMVVGHRSSSMKAYEKYKGKYIFYGTGTADLEVVANQDEIKSLAFVEGERRQPIK